MNGNRFAPIVRTRPPARRRSEQGQQFLLQADRLGPRPLMAQLARPQDHRIDVAFELPALLQQAATFTGIEVVHGVSRVGQKLGTPAAVPIGQNTQ